MATAIGNHDHSLPQHRDQITESEEPTPFQNVRPVLGPEENENHALMDLTFSDTDTKMSSFSADLLNCTLTSVDLDRTIGRYQIESSPKQTTIQQQLEILELQRPFKIRSKN